MTRYHNIAIEHQYDTISHEFDTTRTRIWTSVQTFLIKYACAYQKNGIKSLLDVGVGNGKNILFANKLNYQCLGIDISSNLIDICHRKGINALKSDILDLDESFGKFDTIICIATIHHLENIDDQKQAIVNMIKCLKSNGRLLISVWSKEKGKEKEKGICDEICEKQKNNYREFHIGPNIVEWNSKDGKNKIDRFYYIHDYDSFQQMFEDITHIVPMSLSYGITWEKQNWFCELHIL